VASEAELEDSTGGELLLGGMIAELHNALGASGEQYEDLETLAQWAIRKETKLTTVRHIQGSPSTKNIQRETITPRNPNGTYPPTNNGNQNYGDPMELDATRKRPRFNISREELPKKDVRTTMPQVRTTRRLSQELPKKRWTQTTRRIRQDLATRQENRPLANKTKHSGNRGRTRTRTVGKQRMSPVRDGLRDRPERKPIIMEKYNPALNSTNTLENNNDHIMVKIQLHREK